MKSNPMSCKLGLILAVSAWLPSRIFSGGEICCFANFYCYATFSIVLGEILGGTFQGRGEGKSLQGDAPLSLIEESQSVIIDQTGCYHAVMPLEIGAVWSYLPIQKQNKNSNKFTEEKLSENVLSKYAKFSRAHLNE